MTWQSNPIPGGWEFKHEEGGQIILDYIYPTSRGLEAWVELRVDGEEIPVSQGQRNLMVAQAINPFLSDVADRKDKIPWLEGLRFAFYTTIEAWREGSPTLDLSVIDPKGLQFIIKPIIETGGNTRLIAPGGSGKSLFADAVGLTVATGNPGFLGLDALITGPVLYLDWETTADTHSQRLRALCSPLGVKVPRDGIFYRFESSPLARSVQAVRRSVERYEAILLIVDSALMAAGPSGQSSGEESTGNLYTALREIGIPALIVDHKSAEAIQRGRLGGYGSIFKENLARMQWEFTSYSRSHDKRRFVLSLTKENNVGEVSPLAFTLTTKGGEKGIASAVFKQEDPDAVRAAADVADLGNRLYYLLGAQPGPVEMPRILELLGNDVKEATVRGRLSRDTRFVNVAAKGQRGLYRLSDELMAMPRDDGFQGELEPPEPDDGLLDDLDDVPAKNFSDDEVVF